MAGKVQIKIVVVRNNEDDPANGLALKESLVAQWLEHPVFYLRARVQFPLCLASLFYCNM